MEGYLAEGKNTKGVIQQYQYSRYNIPDTIYQIHSIRTENLGQKEK